MIIKFPNSALGAFGRHFLQFVFFFDKRSYLHASCEVREVLYA